MMKLLLIAALIGTISAASDSEWAVYKAKHGKTYHKDVEHIRRGIWEGNLEKIKSHNVLYEQGLKSYFLGDNEYADMTTGEFVRTMNGFRGDLLNIKTDEEADYAVNVEKLPKTINWVKKGMVTPVKNQGQCGSCWSFSATGSLEAANKKVTGKLVSLSEKNLMDCSKSYGNHGCEGGLMDQAFQYVIANKGIDTEASYPYKPVDGRCRFKRSDVGGTETVFHDIPSGSEKALQNASATIGPISVAIDAGHGSFQLYSGGVYDEPNCSSTMLDHGVLLVGYGAHQGREYWLVKNSWGTTWGQKGYIMMSRNKQNQCGIATQASYPLSK